MTLQDKIAILQLLEDMALKEANLIWRRFSTMLYASTGLFAIFAFSVKQNMDAVALGCAVFGVILSVCWFQIICVSNFYYERWQCDADYIVSEDGELSSIIRGRSSPRTPTTPIIHASKYSLVVPITFLIGWIVGAVSSF